MESLGLEELGGDGAEGGGGTGEVGTAGAGAGKGGGGGVAGNGAVRDAVVGRRGEVLSLREDPWAGSESGEGMWRGGAVRGVSCHASGDGCWSMDVCEDSIASDDLLWD